LLFTACREAQLELPAELVYSLDVYDVTRGSGVPERRELTALEENSPRPVESHSISCRQDLGRPWKLSAVYRSLTRSALDDSLDSLWEVFALLRVMHTLHQRLCREEVPSGIFSFCSLLKPMWTKLERNPPPPFDFNSVSSSKHPLRNPPSPGKSPFLECESFLSVLSCMTDTLQNRLLVREISSAALNAFAEYLKPLSSFCGSPITRGSVTRFFTPHLHHFLEENQPGLSESSEEHNNHHHRVVNDSQSRWKCSV